MGDKKCWYGSENAKRLVNYINGKVLKEKWFFHCFS